MDDHRPELGIELGPVSIVWLETEPGPCACGRKIGSGPVGFRRDEPVGPICDVCLLDIDKEMGMLMWLVHVVRELAETVAGEGEPAKADQAMLILMKFARIYHEGTTWPHRPAAAVDFIDELRVRLSAVPWTEWVKSLRGPV